MSSRRALIQAAGTVRAALARASQQQQGQAAAAAVATGASVPGASAATARPPSRAWAPSSFARAFAADTPADAPAPSLLSVLKREIKHERSAYAPPAVVAAGPPTPFTLVDAPGEAAVSLRREFRGGETITVDCSVNLQDALGPPPGFEDESSSGEDEDGEGSGEEEEGAGKKAGKGDGDGDGDGDEDEDEDDEDEDPGDVAFNVTVSKGGGAGPSLVFECVSDGTYVDVRHVALEGAGKAGKVGAAAGAAAGAPSSSSNADEDALYSGPVFDELDEELQDAFRAYLEARGVDEDLGEYLRWLLVDKEQREYTAWLEGVRGFVSGGGGDKGEKGGGGK